MNIHSKPVWGPYQTIGGTLNYQHLHFQFPAKPFQRWHVIEDRSAPLGFRYRHPRQPGEKPDPKVNFGVEELSARLEHAGVEYLRIALGNDAWSSPLAEVLLSKEIPGEGPEYERWYPAISWVRDDGDPPHAARGAFEDDKCPPRRLAAVPWSIPGKRHQLRWASQAMHARDEDCPGLCGVDLWNNGGGGDYLPRASTAAIHRFPPIW